MKINAQDVLNVVETVDSTDDLDAILSLTVDDAIQLALRKSANTRLEPVWYEKILAKLGDHEKEMFTLGLASSGIKVLPGVVGRKQADLDIESRIDQIKALLQKFVADKGYISEDEYRDALWDHKINGNVPDKVVGAINAWVMQSMLPLRKNKPKSDISAPYKKKVLDQVKHPNMKTFKASKVLAQESVELTDEDKNVIGAFTEKRSDRDERLVSDGRSLKVVMSNRTQLVALWGDLLPKKILVKRTKDNYIRQIIQNLVESADKQEIEFVSDFSKSREDWKKKTQAWLPLEKEDTKAIKSFLDRKVAAGENVFSDGKQLRVVTEDHDAIIASWHGERLMTNPPETQFEDVVLSWLFRWEQKDVAASQLLSAVALLEEQAQATDFAGEQSELERAIMSWEPKLKNLKEWLGNVARAKNFSDLRRIWDQLWATKEDTAFEVDPRKHEYKEYVDLGDDDGESLDLAAAMDGDEDEYQQAYNAVGGDPDKMISWLKSNKGVNTTAIDELKNAIQDWLKNHKKTAKENISDVETLFDYFLKDPHLSKEFSKTYEELKSKGYSDNDIMDTFIGILTEFRQKLLSQVGGKKMKTAKGELVDAETLLDFVTKDKYLSHKFLDMFTEKREQGLDYSMIEADFEEELLDLVEGVAPHTLQSTIVNVAKQLVNIYRDLSDDDPIEGLDKVPEKNRHRYITESELGDLGEKYHEVNKTGLVDTTEPYLRDVIKY